MDLPADLRAAIDAAVSGTPVAALTAAVAGLTLRYRAPDEPSAQAILSDPVQVTAYAAYRMPATYAAVRSALAQVVAAVPGLDPRSLLDLGGGTGAASWAATDTYPGLREVTVLDRVDAALEVGRRLGAARPVLRAARWRRWMVGPDPRPDARGGGDDGDSDTLPAADLVTISYLLGELPASTRASLVTTAAAAGRVVLVIEPGTPGGYARVLTARDALLALGLRVVAPCAHQVTCPLSGRDWCHFAARVNRSALHRRAKGATLGYEDEKFSYVAAVHPAPQVPGDPADPAHARVLRRPTQRKGLVRLRLCTPSGAASDEIISARQGARYRDARGVSWGDAWPCHPTDRSDFSSES